MKDVEASITLCDPMNPSIGYQVHLTVRGETRVLTSRDPVTGGDLLTFAHALRVASYYEQRSTKS